MKQLILMMMMMAACSLMTAVAGDKELTEEEKKILQEELAKKYGVYGKEYRSARSYKEVAYTTLKASKNELKNRMIQYEGTYKGFTDNFPSYVEDSGYSNEKYHLLMVNGVDIPVLVRRKKDIIELVGKLEKGVKVKVYGRVKEFRKEPKRGLAPQYCVDLSNIQILDLKPRKGDTNADGGGNDRRNRRRPKRRR